MVEVLRAAQPPMHGVERIVIWGGTRILNALDNRPWLVKRNPQALDQNLLRRILWQHYRLSQAARDEGCHVLFVPGGSYAGNFHPVVTMSQNLLPFEMPELRRYGWTFFALKLLLLRWTQSRSFKKTDGVIFLTEYARHVVLGVTGKPRGQPRVIPHGVNPRFCRAPKIQRSISEYDDAHPYRILYVSIIDFYKHQCCVIEAVSALRKQGMPVVLDLVGPAFPPALQRLNTTLDRLDVTRKWVNYHGAIEFDALHHHYAQADLGIFASSCENMPNILLETMASGLPIACSDRGPMPEMLGAAGVYFDPEKSLDIARALRELIDSPKLRTVLADLAYKCAKKYSWRACTEETLNFLIGVASATSDEKPMGLAK